MLHQVFANNVFVGALILLLTIKIIILPENQKSDILYVVYE